LRKIKTLRGIREAFVSLCKEKKVDKITVKELCERALINKATFYAHYENIDGLIIEFEDEYVKNITGKIDFAGLFFTDPEQFLLKLWQSYRDAPNGVFLLSGRRGWDLLGLLLEALCRSIYRARPDIKQVEGIDIALTYMICGFSGVAPLHRKETVEERAKQAGRATLAVLREFGLLRD
jgi:AcrR family transcriptional regulator